MRLCICLPGSTDYCYKGSTFWFFITHHQVWAPRGKRRGANWFVGSQPRGVLTNISWLALIHPAVVWSSVLSLIFHFDLILAFPRMVVVMLILMIVRDDTTGKDEDEDDDNHAKDVLKPCRLIPWLVPILILLDPHLDNSLKESTAGISMTKYVRKRRCATMRIILLWWLGWAIWRYVKCVKKKLWQQPVVAKASAKNSS